MTIERAAEVIAEKIDTAPMIDAAPSEVRRIRSQQIAQALSDAGLLAGGETVRALAVSADFEPEDCPEGFVEWTFAVPKHQPFGAGLYDITFARRLDKSEIDNPHSALPLPPAEGA